MIFSVPAPLCKTYVLTDFFAICFTSRDPGPPDSISQLVPGCRCMWWRRAIMSYLRVTGGKQRTAGEQSALRNSLPVGS